MVPSVRRCEKIFAEHAGAGGGVVVPVVLFDALEEVVGVLDQAFFGDCFGLPFGAAGFEDIQEVGVKESFELGSLRVAAKHEKRSDELV